MSAFLSSLSNLLQRPPVGWWDLLDIAIVSILIYEFLKLIRGTRAVQMAVGSLLIVGCSTCPGWRRSRRSTG